MKIGIIREDKFPPDKRVVFTPDTCVKTVKRFPKIEFFVQRSSVRCFSEKEYLEKGFNIVDDIKKRLLSSNTRSGHRCRCCKYSKFF